MSKPCDVFLFIDVIFVDAFLLGLGLGILGNFLATRNCDGDGKTRECVTWVCNTCRYVTRMYVAWSSIWSCDVALAREREHVVVAL